MNSVIIITTLLALTSLYRCDAFSSTNMQERRTISSTPLDASSLLSSSVLSVSSSSSSSCSPTALNMGGRTNKQRREDRGRHNNGNEMLEFIDTPVTSKEMVGDIDSIAAAPEDDDLADLVRCIVRAADGRKADNIVAMRVSKVSTVTSFVVIATGNSRPQNQAITAVVKDEVEEAFGFLPGGNGVPEGSADSGWTVLDYGSVMVHVMTPKSRLFYNVEGKWQDEGGEYMDISDAILPNVNFVKLEDGGSDSGDGDGEDTTGSTMEGVAEEDDPFWS